MAKKKPPEQPTPPPDDFDPELELSEDIAPLDDDMILDEAAEPVEDVVAAEDLAGDEIVPEEVIPDEVVESKATEDIVLDEADAELEPQVVDAEEASAEVEPASEENVTRLVLGDDVEPLPEVVDESEMVEASDVEAVDGDADVVDADVIDVDAAEIDAEVVADDALIEDEGIVVDADDALVSEDSGEVAPAESFADSEFGDAMSGGELSDEHDAETVASMPALDDDDPFAGVGGEGGDEDAAVAEGEDGELVGAGVGADGVDSPYFEDEAPKPKTHWFVWTLIGLNIIAAFAAPYMLILTLQKRQEYTYATFRYDLAMLGLPNREEESATTAARATLPGYKISKEEIKRIVGQRIGGINDPIEGFEEQIIERIPPSKLDRDLLKDHFGEHFVEGGGEPIRTVEDEIERVNKQVLSDIQKAAEETLALTPGEDAKRARIERMLHPLAMDQFQSEELAKLIKEAKGPDLDKLYMEAAQRRMAFDFLLPLELFRPGDVKGLFIERFGNISGREPPKGVEGEPLQTLKALPLSEVLERVTKRIGSTIDKNYQPAIHLGDDWATYERDTVEKRLTASFTLISLAHLRRPDGELLYPKLMERIPLVMGQYDFSLACELFPARLLNLNERVIERIKIDREGFVAPGKDGSLVRGKAFIDFYEDELQRIRFVQNDIFKAKIRLRDLQDQKTRYEKLLAERTAQRDDVLKKIAIAREKTAKDAKELRVFQNELHRYQLELATSEADLEQAHDDIRKQLGKKGAAPK